MATVLSRKVITKDASSGGVHEGQFVRGISRFLQLPLLESDTCPGESECGVDMLSRGTPLYVEWTHQAVVEQIDSPRASVSGSVRFEREHTVCKVLFPAERGRAPGCRRASARGHGHTLILIAADWHAMHWQVEIYQLQPWQLPLRWDLISQAAGTVPVPGVPGTVGLAPEQLNLLVAGLSTRVVFTT